MLGPGGDSFTPSAAVGSLRLPKTGKQVVVSGGWIAQPWWWSTT